MEEVEARRGGKGAAARRWWRRAELAREEEEEERSAGDEECGTAGSGRQLEVESSTVAAATSRSCVTAEA